MDWFKNSEEIGMILYVTNNTCQTMLLHENNPCLAGQLEQRGRAGI